VSNISTIFVGHDPREQEAFDVCEYSIKARSFINVIRLSSKDIGEYTRPWYKQSTDFTYTRFLVPYLMGFKGWAAFVDCDFLFLSDPSSILYENEHLKDYPVSVCKHPQYIPNSKIKMDGIEQHSMWRKNWASLILFNCDHPSNKVLTPDYVNTAEGRDMHQFSWLDDSEIGSIPLNWNVLDDYYLIDHPRAIHYTDGGPWFENYQETTYSDMWKRERDNLNVCRLSQ
jgi:hypothetical protein